MEFFDLTLRVGLQEQSTAREKQPTERESRTYDIYGVSVTATPNIALPAERAGTERRWAGVNIPCWRLNGKPVTFFVTSYLLTFSAGMLKSEQQKIEKKKTSRTSSKKRLPKMRSLHLMTRTDKNASWRCYHRTTGNCLSAAHVSNIQ